MYRNNIINKIDKYLARLFPLNRSILGEENRKTLKILNEIVPIKVLEYPSGTNVYDWQIPDEWNVKEAWIKDDKGKKIIDYKVNNIHLVSYSKPIKKKINFNNLKKHLFFDKNKKNAIPYRTSYYKRDWGFCITYNQFKNLKKTKGLFEVFIDSKFNPKGSLTVGELLIPGTLKEEILISTYFCHPSLANDNLSGTLLTTFLASELLKKRKLKYSYRFLWLPETIGAIAYSYMNEKTLKKIKNGLVISTVGGPGKFSYKQSWDKHNSINNYVEKTFKDLKKKFICYPFDVHGSDERQFSSIGFRINVITISKDRYYEYPEYHTSEDNLSLVSGKNIFETLKVYLKLIENLENKLIYKSKITHCETMLSKYNLYPKNGGALKPNKYKKSELDILLWLLFLSDGYLSTYDISKKINIDHRTIVRYYSKLEKKGLVKKI